MMLGKWSIEKVDFEPNFKKLNKLDRMLLKSILSDLIYDAEDIAFGGDTERGGFDRVITFRDGDCLDIVDGYQNCLRLYNGYVVSRLYIEQDKEYIIAELGKYNDDDPLEETELYTLGI